MSRGPWRVLFFGTPQFAVPTLERLIGSPHRVVGVVTQPDRPRGRGHHVHPCPVKASASAHGLPVFHPERLGATEWLTGIRDLGADVGVVAAYGRLLPQALLDALPEGFLNVHASLLPRWRGAAPIHRAVIAGDAVTGVTIMRVVLALDAGPMLARVETPIGAGDTSESVEARLAALGGDLLVRTLDALTEGPMPAEPQADAEVTYAAKLERKDSIIDWSLPAAVIDRRIRGLQPWPLAVAQAEGRAVALLHSTVVPGQAGAAPGRVLQAAGDRLVIACGDEAVAISRVKPEGRRPMPVRDFLNGVGIRVGMTWT